MLELILVMVGVTAAGLLGFAVTAVTAGLLTVIGLAILVLGLALGLPTGFWYHVMLYRAVSARTPLPRTWWLAPARLHPGLTRDEARRIAPWYRAGGVGFLLAVAGGATAIASALAQR